MRARTGFREQVWRNFSFSSSEGNRIASDDTTPTRDSGEAPERAVFESSTALDKCGMADETQDRSLELSCDLGNSASALCTLAVHRVASGCVGCTSCKLTHPPGSPNFSRRRAGCMKGNARGARRRGGTVCIPEQSSWVLRSAAVDVIAG